MSRLVDRSEYEYDSSDYELGERVSFLYEGERLEGEVVRVYNTREWYHVRVRGERYMVSPFNDEMRRE